MIAKWAYIGEDGKRLAGPFTWETDPPIGWPVTIVGPEFGPARNYKVISRDDDKKTLVLRRDEQ